MGKTFKNFKGKEASRLQQDMILGVADYPSLEGSLEDFLNFASKLRVRVVELKLDRLDLLLALSKNDKLIEIKNLSKSYDFKYFVHAPNIDINWASVNPLLRRALEKIIKKVVNFSVTLDAGLIVSHVGRLSRDYPQKLVEKAMENAADSLRKMNQLSNDFGIIFTIENDHKSNDYVLAGYPRQISSLIKDVGCKLTFDVGHANTIGKIENFTKLLGKYIVNVHIHDNNGKVDQHLPVGKGSIDLVRLLKRAKDWVEEKPLIIECHNYEGIKESIGFMRQKF